MTIRSFCTSVWCFVRGIHVPDRWRARCARCGFTGQLHYDTIPIQDCMRFKMPSAKRKIKIEGP